MSKNTIKIPNSGYLYFIERILNSDIPFDNSLGSLNINGKIYDIVHAGRNIGLDRISDMIINLDNHCFEKVNPGKELGFADIISKELNIKINQLLFG